MTATTNTNGRNVRKSLAEQIDRLEQLLEGLGNTINETVQDAVQVAINEVLMNTELQSRLRETQNAATAQPKVQGWFNWMGNAVKGSCTTAWSKVSWVCAKVAEGAQKCWSWLCQKTTQTAAPIRKAVSLGWTWCWRKLKNAGIWSAERTMRLVAGCRNLSKGMSAVGQFLWHIRKSLVLALGVGCVVGLGCYLAGPVISSLVSGLAGFAGALFGSAMNALRRALAGVSLQHSYPESPSMA
jgi:hypothetical protein